MIFSENWSIPPWPATAPFATLNSKIKVFLERLSIYVLLVQHGRRWAGRELSLLPRLLRAIAPSGPLLHSIHKHGGTL